MLLLRSIPNGKSYIGVAADVAKRLGEHNSKNGRWISSYKPWELAASEEFPDRAAAARRERFLKSRAGLGARKELAGKHGEGKI